MRWLASLLLLIPALALSPAGASAQAADDAPDFAIPDGRFFTEALPDRTDTVGFAVQDGHGVKLWTAYQAHGGVDELGYPISRRFELDGRVAQAFEHGILRWDPTADDAEVLDRAATPGLKKLPTYAIQPDLPPRASAELQTRPWSGWWWPASDGVGPTLYGPNSPLAKYDRYVALATGEDPGTYAWERNSVHFPGTAWAGHCNGSAAAALLEPEPTEPRDVLGITFSVGDLKGLLVDYHFGDAAAWSYGGDGELNPADFHRQLLDWLGGTGKGFVVTFDLGNGEVWSYPAYRFDSEWSMDATEPDVWHVKTTVWMADMDVPVNFVGTRPYPGPAGKTFEYILRGDPRDPSDGAWTGASQRGGFAHPGRIWYPEPLARNLDRELVSPGLDRETLGNILSPAEQAAATP